MVKGLVGMVALCLALAGCANGMTLQGAGAGLNHAYSVVYKIRSAICNIPLPAPSGASSAPSDGAGSGGSR
jgi:hypothetical protein